MAENKTHIPQYVRLKNPPSMRLTDRDKKILESIYSHDGMLGFSQIKRMFFTGESQAKKRLMLLYQNEYLNRPNREQRRRVPEMVYWLDKRGAQIVASLNSVSEKELKWLKLPRWFQVEHDLAVNDFRIALTHACTNNKDIDLKEWISEREFRAYPDKISYRYQNRKLERNIIPDGYFILSTEKSNVRYLLEIDRGTEDNPRFLREKILPGIAYIRSDLFEKRFGFNRARWLVVTTSKKRLENMLRQAKLVETKGTFFFTTFEKISVPNILSNPIWYRPDRNQPVKLIIPSEKLTTY